MTHRTRRSFMKVAGGAVAGAAATSARSYGRVLGANDRINIGFLGCGGRSAGLRRMVEMSFGEKNLGVVAVCDLWTGNREKAAADCKERFGAERDHLAVDEPRHRPRALLHRHRHPGLHGGERRDLRVAGHPGEPGHVLGAGHL